MARVDLDFFFIEQYSFPQNEASIDVHLISNFFIPDTSSFETYYLEKLQEILGVISSNNPGASISLYVNQNLPLNPERAPCAKFLEQLVSSGIKFQNDTEQSAGLHEQHLGDQFEDLFFNMPDEDPNGLAMEYDPDKEKDTSANGNAAYASFASSSKTRVKREKQSDDEDSYSNPEDSKLAALDVDENSDSDEVNVSKRYNFRKGAERGVKSVSTEYFTKDRYKPTKEDLKILAKLSVNSVEMQAELTRHIPFPFLTSKRTGHDSKTDYLSHLSKSELEEFKIRRRGAKNRVSARECSNRKREKYEFTQTRNVELEVENGDLKQEISQLKKTIAEVSEENQALKATQQPSGKQSSARYSFFETPSSSTNTVSKGTILNVTVDKGPL